MAEFDGGETGADETSATPTRFCHSCGTKLSDPVGRFCQSCGAEVGSGAETGAAPEPGESSGPTAQEPAQDPEPAPEGADDSAGEPPSSPEPPNRKRSRWWVLALLAIVAVIAAGVILLTGGSSGSKKSSQEGGITTLPSPGELPPRTVAIISHVSSALGTVTRAELAHAIAQSAASAGLGSPPRPGSSKYEETADSALETLLQSIWIQGEAADLGLDITSSEIAAERAKVKRESFKSEAQYRKFLVESHYTESDVRERVKSQILSEKIRERIEGKVKAPTSDEIARYYDSNKQAQFRTPAHGSSPAHVQPLAAVSAEIRRQLKQQAEQKDFTDFTTRFSNKWRSRTVCLPIYAIKDCSNGPALDEPSQSGSSETATGGAHRSDSAACSEHTEAPSGAKSYPCPDFEETLPAGSTAAVKTNFGTFTIELATEEAPLTSTSFAYLAEKGFYNGLTFHRVVPGFVIQGGDPLGTGRGGPGYSVVEKPPKDLTYPRGVVAMAKAATEPAGTSGSQFFVVTGADAGLPPEYALLGRVGQGMGTVTKIGKLPTAGEKPKERVVMEEVTIGRG